MMVSLTAGDALLLVFQTITKIGAIGVVLSTLDKASPKGTHATASLKLDVQSHEGTVVYGGVAIALTL